MNKKNGLSPYRQRKLIEAFCADLTATQAAKLLKLNRNTVNRYFGIFREAIYDHQQRRLNRFRGVVEVDESYFGATRRRGDPGERRRGRGSSKQAIFGIIKRGGEVFTELVPDVKRKTLQALIKRKVYRDAIIISDGHGGYDGLVSIGYQGHLRIDKAQRKREGKSPFADGRVHINGIESFWAFAKGRLAKFKGTRANMELHIKECEWRWRKDYATLINELRRLLV